MKNPSKLDYIKFQMLSDYLSHGKEFIEVMTWDGMNEEPTDAFHFLFEDFTEIQKKVANTNSPEELFDIFADESNAFFYMDKDDRDGWIEYVNKTVEKVKSNFGPFWEELTS